MKKSQKSADTDEPSSEDEELSMGGWLSDRMDSLQDEQDEWEQSEEAQAVSDWAASEVLDDEEEAKRSEKPDEK